MSDVPSHPVQTTCCHRGGQAPQSVTMAAYEVYCHVYGPQEAMVTDGCRGGFSAGELIAHRGEGYNGPPSPLTCPGRERCAGTCGQRSVHAEMRALRDAERYRRHHESGPFDLVHVELAADGGVVACDGPSCWQCAREILDVGFVDGVWLYELSGEQQSSAFSCSHGQWRRYTAAEFYRVTLTNCGISP